MKTNFAYIDEVMDRAVATEAATPTIASEARAKATKDAKRLIGGFRVHDKELEAKYLDALILARKAEVENFRLHRADLRSKLQVKGLQALAILPTGAWYSICKKAGLFVLSPDAQNKVFFTKGAFATFTGKWADKDMENLAGKDKAAFLSLMFPQGISLLRGPSATLVLPDPPADVAETLVKAQSFKLTVAAVPDAIRFAETMGELRTSSNTSAKDLWAQDQGYADYADWIKRDPIIFTEQGSAVAVLAQFGEFPIEQQIVDAVVHSDGLLSEKPSIGESMGGLPNLGDDAMNTMYRYMNERNLFVPMMAGGQISSVATAAEAEYQRCMAEEQHRASREAIAQQEYDRMVRMARSAPPRINSADWTGRT